MDGVQGTVAEGFEGVRDRFAAVVGGSGTDAQLAACHHGRTVVDLWVGPDAAADSLLSLYSATKGVTHLVVALLVQEGLLDLDRPVSSYWPEFAAEGKQDVRVRELLAHQAGLIGVAGGFSLDELADDRVVAERLATQRPLWRPGAASGYHALVMAALSGELVRRVTGRDLGDLVSERFARPLGLDLHLGLPATAESRFLPPQPPEPISTPAGAVEPTGGPDSLAGIAFNRQSPTMCEVWELPARDAVRSRGPASFGGFSGARDLARLYAALVDPVDGHGPLLDPGTVAAFGQIQSSGFDLVLRQQKAWAVGFHASSEIYPMLGAGAFGHSGAGGQQALVDPSHHLSYALLHRRSLAADRTDAVHAALLDALLTAAAAQEGTAVR